MIILRPLKAVCLFIAIILVRMELSLTRYLQFQVICEQKILSPQSVGINRTENNFGLKMLVGHQNFYRD